MARNCRLALLVVVAWRALPTKPALSCVVLAPTNPCGALATLEVLISKGVLAAIPLFAVAAPPVVVPVC